MIALIPLDSQAPRRLALFLCLETDTQFPAGIAYQRGGLTNRHNTRILAVEVNEMKIRLLALGGLLLASRCWASDYYSQSFTSAPGPEWSGTHLPITVSDTGRTYLGPLSQDQAKLTLSGMPAHHKITLSFQLYLWRGWGGNVTPSLFSLSTDTGQTLIRTTFGTALNSGGTYGGQSYPGSY